MSTAMNNQVEQSLTISNCNMLTPAFAMQKRINPFQEAKVIFVKLDANSKDVYPQSGNFALTKTGLMKLAGAAGIKVTTRIINTNKDYVCVEAIASYMNANGSTQVMNGLHEIDMDVIREKKPKEAGQIQQFKLQLCESKAINRAIRSILSIQSTYTKEELSKPFAVPIVQFSPDFTDPEIKTATINRMIGDVGTLYGQESKPTQQIEATQAESAPLLESGNNEAFVTQGEVVAEIPEQLPEIPQTKPLPANMNTPQDQISKEVCSNCGSRKQKISWIAKTTGKKTAAYLCPNNKECGEPPRWSSYEEPKVNATAQTGPGF